MVEITSWLLLSAQMLLGFIGVIFLLSGLDDLFIDLNFLFRSLYRKLFVLPKYKKLSPEELRSAAEKPIAIMIPAWDESAVIRPMLENTLRTLESRTITFLWVPIRTIRIPHGKWTRFVNCSPTYTGRCVQRTVRRTKRTV